MKKIALIAAFAFAGLPFAFGQTNPPAQSGANPPANQPAETTTPAKHHKKAKTHKKAGKRAKSGTANRAMPGEK